MTAITVISSHLARLRKGISECFRVLICDGVLVFKGAENEVKLRDVLALSPEQCRDHMVRHERI